jgi:hypothetical protein
MMVCVLATVLDGVRGAERRGEGQVPGDGVTLHAGGWRLASPGTENAQPRQYTPLPKALSPPVG